MKETEPFSELEKGWFLTRVVFGVKGFVNREHAVGLCWVQGAELSGSEWDTSTLRAAGTIKKWSTDRVIRNHVK